MCFDLIEKKVKSRNIIKIVLYQYIEIYMEYASKALWVTEAIKKKIMNMCEHPRDTHNMIMVRLVDFWEENHGREQDEKHKEQDQT